MLRAAGGLAAEVRRILTADGGQTVVILAAAGDNGGDALFAGAEVARAGFDVTVVPTGSRMHEAGRAAAVTAGAIIASEDGGAPERIRDLVAGCDVLVDGILGIGVSADPALRGRAREVVSALLPLPPRPTVVAVDLPSGVHPDSGSAPGGVVLPADVTVTFGGIKAGLLLPPGSELAGRVHLVDIGLGPGLAGIEPLVRLSERASPGVSE